MKKIHIPTELEMAIDEREAAKYDLDRARDNFNYAFDDYFEIANKQLSIAQDRYNLCCIKIRKLCVK